MDITIISYPHDKFCQISKGRIGQPNKYPKNVNLIPNKKAHSKVKLFSLKFNQCMQI